MVLSADVFLPGAHSPRRADLRDLGAFLRDLAEGIPPIMRSLYPLWI